MVCDDLMKKIWLLLNWPASHSPFWPKLWMPLAAVFVEIFSKEKNWRGFRPYLVTLWKEFEIPLKNGFLKIFEGVNCPGQFSGSWIIQDNLSHESFCHESCWIDQNTYFQKYVNWQIFYIARTYFWCQFSGYFCHHFCCL